MFEEHAATKLKQVEVLLGEVMKDFEPEVVDSDYARDLLQSFTKIERVAATGKAMTAKRVADSGSWRADGDRSAAHWMARSTGVPVGEAVGVLETAERVANLPGVDEAMRAGKLSQAQAREVSEAAKADPSSESGLLKLAQEESVEQLRKECSRVKAAALPDEKAHHEGVRLRRRFRHWTTNGEFRFEGLTTVDEGAKLLAGMRETKTRLVREAKKQGRREPDEASAVDALVVMAEHMRDCGERPQRMGPGTLVHVTVSHEALTRGHVEGGEVCEIPGVGPIPVATAEALASDAIIAGLLYKGTDVTKVCHFGRTINATLRTALIARDPVCVVPGCDVSEGLEIDHNKPVTEHGPTSLKNTQRGCNHHHYLKTHKGFGWADETKTKWVGPKNRLERAGPEDRGGKKGASTPRERAVRAAPRKE
jgi:hypothetical protein